MTCTLKSCNLVNFRPPNSPFLIKPLRVERCIKCDMRIRGNESHSCSERYDLEFYDVAIACTGCKQQFMSVEVFDMHVSGLHCDNIESLFFPTMNGKSLYNKQ
jgi:hypothetical protein